MLTYIGLSENEQKSEKGRKQVEKCVVIGREKEIKVALEHRGGGWQHDCIVQDRESNVIKGHNKKWMEILAWAEKHLLYINDMNKRSSNYVN